MSKMQAVKYFMTKTGKMLLELLMTAAAFLLIVVGDCLEFPLANAVGLGLMLLALVVIPVSSYGMEKQKNKGRKGAANNNAETDSNQN